MSRIAFLLEEASMKITLESILPKIGLRSDEYQLIAHMGKNDLETSIPIKLRGWREPGIRFLVLRDKDATDCKALITHLKRICSDAGRPDTIIRLAIHELESWFLGDLEAVAKAYPKCHILEDSNLRKYQQPDHLANAKQELRRAIPSYQPVSGARLIAPQLDISKNRSHSFAVFINGVAKLTQLNLLGSTN